jgi:hypothetical protein
MESLPDAPHACFSLRRALQEQEVGAREAILRAEAMWRGNLLRMKVDQWRHLAAPSDKKPVAPRRRLPPSLGPPAEPSLPESIGDSPAQPPPPAVALAAQGLVHNPYSFTGPPPPDPSHVTPRTLPAPLTLAGVPLGCLQTLPRRQPRFPDPHPPAVPPSGPSGPPFPPATAHPAIQSLPEPFPIPAMALAAAPDTWPSAPMTVLSRDGPEAVYPVGFLNDLPVAVTRKPLPRSHPHPDARPLASILQRYQDARQSTEAPPRPPAGLPPPS